MERVKESTVVTWIERTRDNERDMEKHRLAEIERERGRQTRPTG